MSGAMMLYLLTISLWLMLAAVAAEWVLVRLHRPGRWTWVVALLLCVALPFLPVRPATPPTDAQAAQVPAPVAAHLASIPSAAVTPEWTLDFAVPRPWFYLASLITGSLLLTGWALLILRARRWSAAELDGVKVLSAPATGPAVVGFLRPRIVVPEWAFTLPPDQRRMLLAHEQSHIDAGDPLMLLGAALVVVAMPWNPLLWFGLHRLRGAIEIDCDRRVLAGGEEVEGYARCLVDTVTLAAGGPAPAVSSLALSSSHLERRVALMLRTSRPYKIVSLIAAIVSVGLVTTAFMKAPPAPSEADIAFARANAAALDIASKRTANYYERLTAGKMASPSISYGVLYENWTVIDKNRKGEGC